jgi:hypothetical protein
MRDTAERMRTSPGLPKDVSDYLWLLAESAVSIPMEYVPRKGGEWGRWTRSDRVMLVWSALCAMARTKKPRRGSRISKGQG